MKFRYHAVDRNGRPTSGLMEAPDEIAAREMLLDATIFPKRIESAESDSPVTWRPTTKSTRDLKEKVDRQRRGETDGNDILFSCRTEFMEAGSSSGQPVTLQLRREDLTLQIPGQDNIRLTGSDIETCQFTGVIQKQWDLVLLDGRQFTFAAGRLKIKPELTQIHQRIMTWIM